ncbi:hypothetical protein RB213_003290 [Colletotrichum asianum]
MAEAAEPTMDCNLPELLAQDLEFSSLIFASKNMTAGAPSPALASDEDEWPSAEPPTVLGAPCHPNGVPQFQPLGAIDEKSSGASENDSDAASSSGASFSEAEDGDDEAAASPQIRQQSVLTTDTTISASSQPPAPPPATAPSKRLVSFCDGSEEEEEEGMPVSWMDLEPEGPGDHPELGKSLDQSPVTTPIKPVVRPLSRLGDKSINESQSPPRIKSANAATTTRRLTNPFEGYTRPTSRARSLHVNPTPAPMPTTPTPNAGKERKKLKEKETEQNRLSVHSLHSIEIAVPTRSSSLKHRVSFTDDARKTIASRSRARSHASSTRTGSDHWSRIRNLFPTGSDYLCDALYAHIVAYNYLAPMVQHAARPPTPGTPETTGTTDESIPKKAATLLGLQGMQETTPPPPRPLRKRSSMFLGLRACSSRQSSAPPVPVTPVPTADVTLRDLQIGIRRCIARLVATLRAEGADGPLAGESVNEIDPLIMRSLCEIVKCCEESSTNDRSL